MDKNIRPIHLCIAFDQNFLTPFYVLIASIFKNNSREHFFFHVIATGLSSTQKEAIFSYISNNGSSIHFYTVTPAEVRDFVLPKNSHFNLATYYRLFFPALVPASVEKILYLDTDTVVIGDLSELYDIAMDNCPVAASADPKVTKRPDLGIQDEYNYFNAGVLLINNVEWNRQQISKKAIEYLAKFPEKIEWADQDALNAVLVNNWKKIPHRFNVTYYDLPAFASRKELNRFLTDKVIIHYTTQHKPWLKTCANRLRYLYHSHLKDIPIASKKSTDAYSVLKVLTILKIRLKEFFIDYTPFLDYKKHK